MRSHNLFTAVNFYSLNCCLIGTKCRNDCLNITMQNVHKSMNLILQTQDFNEGIDEIYKNHGKLFCSGCFLLNYTNCSRIY